MRNLLTTLLLILLLPDVATAHNFEVDGIYYNINGNEAIVTYRGTTLNEYSNEYSGDIIIPSSVTFNGTSYIITAIGDNAFHNCTELTSIEIPNSVISIGTGAFNSCSGLSTVTIPSSISFIGQQAFMNCIGLMSIEIPYSVTTIGHAAFYNCNAVESITVENGNPIYDSRNCCNAIIETEKNTLIVGCKNTIIPNSVTSIFEFAFKCCYGLISIQIPNSVTSIGYAAFSDCSGLTSIAIPNPMTTIGDYAFAECSKLSNISISNSVSDIGSDAFRNTPWYNNQPDGLVYAGSVAYKYKGTMPSNDDLELIEGTLGIAGSAFRSCYNLTSIKIPNSVKTIGHSAFRGCTNLKSIDIPHSVSSIGSFVFWNCAGLSSVVIPNSITSIGQSAFADCTSLTSIEIPNSVTSIEGFAFSGCAKLKKIEIGNSVRSTSNLVFDNCPSITDVYCYAITPPVCWWQENSFSTYSATLHVPATSLAAYFTATCWRNFEIIVGDAVAPTEISINLETVDMQLGEQLLLTATVTPANASNKEITWISTDTIVASVDNGIVTAVSYGECDIIASCFGMQAICHISIANRITLEQDEAMLLPNHMLTLTPIAPVMPDGFIVTSSDPTVAAARIMNGKLQVVGIKEGTTTITVGSADGIAIPAACLVTVYTEPGDLNCDGFVNMDDLTTIINYLLTDDATNIKLANADLNGNGSANMDDLTLLINKLLTDN